MKLIFKILIAIVVIALIGAIVLFVGNIVGWWHIGDLVGEMKTYEFDNADSVKDFSFDVSTAQVKFVPGEKLKVESNHKYVSVQTIDGVLTIKEDKANLPINVKMPDITITVPASKTFDSVDIKTIAGTIGGAGLKANKMSVNLTGGGIGFSLLTVNERIVVNSTGGAVKIENSVLNNPDMNLTAGDCDISAQLVGNSNLRCGSGALKLTLEGARDDYAITFKKIIGSAKLEGVSAEADKIYGSGKNTVRLDGAAGSIEVFYANK